MFEIYADDLLIFDDITPDESLKLISPKLTLAINASGSLEFTMPETNVGYNAIKHRKTNLYVKRDGVEIWRGRAISEKRDFYNSRSYICEGALSFLNDTANQSSVITGSPKTVFESILSNHNTSRTGTASVNLSDDRKVYPGTVGISSDTDIKVEPNGAKNYDAISSLVSTYGGIMRTRIAYNETLAKDVITLDWLADYPAAAGTEQSIEFGENLMDFTRNFDSADAVNAVWVRGAKYTETVQGVEVESNYTSGWHLNSTSITNYGRVEAFLDMPDLQSNAECGAEADKYLSSVQFEDITIDISALDLHLLNPSIKPFELLDRVHVSSWAHGMDKTFAVVGVAIPLDDPSHETFTLSDPTVPYKRRVKTLVEQTQQQIVENEQAIERTSRETKEYVDDAVEEVAEEAQDNLETAKAVINATMNSMSEGYIFIDYSSPVIDPDTGQVISEGSSQGIYIVDHPINSLSEIQTGWNVWKWNNAGFGHTNNYQGSNTDWNVALTHDGWIKGDRILANTLLVTAIKLFGDMAVYESSAEQANIGGYIGYGAGHNGVDPTAGIHMFVPRPGNTNDNEVIVTTDGVRISVGDSGGGSYHFYIDNNGNVRIGLDDGTYDMPVTVRVHGDLYVDGQIVGLSS